MAGRVIEIPLRDTDDEVRLVIYCYFDCMLVMLRGNTAYDAQAYVCKNA